MSIFVTARQACHVWMQALPDTADEVRARIDELKQEAAPLLAKKAKVDAHANRCPKLILHHVQQFGIRLAQLGLCYC